MNNTINRRSFVQGTGLLGMSLLLGEKAAALGRSLPPFPTADEMYGWAADVVQITNRHKQYRRSGSQGDAEVRQYIMDKLKSFGIPVVENQTYTFSRHVYEQWSLEAGGNDVPCFF